MILQRRQPTLVAAHRPQPEWLDDFADAARATDLLVHHLRRDRIPAVVRRSAPNLAGRSLLEMLAAGETSQLLEAVRGMFDFGDAHA